LRSQPNARDWHPSDGLSRRPGQDTFDPAAQTGRDFRLVVPKQLQDAHYVPNINVLHHHVAQNRHGILRECVFRRLTVLGVREGSQLCLPVAFPCPFKGETARRRRNQPSLRHLPFGDRVNPPLDLVTGFPRLLAAWEWVTSAKPNITAVAGSSTAKPKSENEHYVPVTRDVLHPSTYEDENQHGGWYFILLCHICW
jgi:hypothetical protein